MKVFNSRLGIAGTLLALLSCLSLAIFALPVGAESAEANSQYGFEYDSYLDPAFSHPALKTTLQKGLFKLHLIRTEMPLYAETKMVKKTLDIDPALLQSIKDFRDALPAYHGVHQIIPGHSLVSP